MTDVVFGKSKAMMIGRSMLVSAAMLSCLNASAFAAPGAAMADPPVDAAYPASMAAVGLPTGGVSINAVLYLASGKGAHPTLLLFHGFPGNEQNLDLAQAARRAGWNVLTLHYRGSWGSPGTFSFAHCAQDAAAAIAFVRDPANAARWHIDPARIAVAGHSMGGMMAARVLADDPALLGAFLIDPADLAAIGRKMKADPSFLAAFRREEIDGDMPPLNAEEADVVSEWMAADPKFDLAATIGTLKGRRLAIYSAARGLGDYHAAEVAAARKAGGPLSEAVVQTDHSFSDHRLWLTGALLDWLFEWNRMMGQDRACMPQDAC